MSNRVEEQTGGSAGYPFAAGNWTKDNGTQEQFVIGFVPEADGAMTNYEYKNGVDYDAIYGLDYSAFYANKYYHLPFPIKKATFDVNVTLYFD